MSISANAQITLIDTTEAYTILLTNEAQQFPTNSSRVPLSNVSYYTDIIVYQGTTKRTDYVIGKISSANNITVSQTSSRITFSVSTASALSADSGTFTIPITIDGQIFNKIFSWSCAKQGEIGVAAKSVNITASSQVFKSTDGGTTFSPDTITLTPVFQGGISYSKWQYSVDGGSTWTDVTSGSHGLTISSGVLTIAKTSDLYTDSITSISFKCISSNSSYYDTITVLKLYDVTGLQDDLEDLQNQITTITDTISGVESKVNANTKSITDKVWQTDISTSINEYDGSTVKTIRDRVTSTEKDISGMKTTLSNVQTTVSEKADGSTVQTLSNKVATIESDYNGFKTTVSDTYTTKEEFNDLEIGGTQILRGTNTVTKLTSTAAWSDGKWRSASGGTGTRESITVTDAPNANIKVGWHLSSTSGAVDIAQDSVPVTNGESYTMSCYAKGNGILRLQYGKSPYPAKSYTLSNTTKWTRFSFTFTIGGQSDNSTNGITNIYFGTSTNGDIQICGVKLELGNKATDWTPAPEDVDEQIYSSINTFELTAQNLRSEIINVKEELSSTFEQTSEELTMRVENAESSLETVVNESIPKINKEVDDAVAQLQVQIDNITGTVAVVKDDVTTMSQSIQDAYGWKMLFATLGMYDGDDIGEKPNNVIWMNQEGIRVSNRDPSDQQSKIAGNTTLITDKEFSGWVNDGSATGDGTKMFEFNKEHVYTNRLKADNGIDLIALKIVPAKYDTVNALNFISGSGNS